MIQKIINDTVSLLEKEGIYIFIETDTINYGKSLQEHAIYSIDNKNYKLKLYAQKVDIDRIFPIITFLDSVLSKEEKDHNDFNDKIIEFFTFLSPFKDKIDSFKKISESIQKVMKIKDVLVLEDKKDKLQGINSKGKSIEKTVEKDTAEYMALNKNGGVYLNHGAKLRSLFVGNDTYSYIEPLKGRDNRIGLIIFNSEKPISIKNINIFKQFASLAGIFIEIHIFRENMSKLLENSLNVMIDALDSRTKGGKNHTKRVTEIYVNFGKYLKLSQEDLEILKVSSLLHDIGKIGVSDTILNKEGPLTEEEMNKVRYHVIYGKEIVSKIKGIDKKVEDIIMYHHERYDGKGYPNGLKGKEIPFFAKLLIFADIYEALTSDRSYRKAYDHEFAINYIKENKGKIFDPELTDKFIDFIGGNKY